MIPSLTNPQPHVLEIALQLYRARFPFFVETENFDRNEDVALLSLCVGDAKRLVDAVNKHDGSIEAKH